jgi:hypothetical protein
VPPLRTVSITRYVTPLREGGSLPAIVEADDLGTYVLKFRGAGQGEKVLVAELVAGEIARAIGLRVPELVLAELDPRITMTGAEFSPAETIADRYAARFQVEATLTADTVHTLSFVATDEAGNASEPTVVTVEHETRHGIADVVTLELYVNGGATPIEDPVTIAAGDTLRAVGVATDAAGHVIEAPVVILTSIPGAFVAGTEISNFTVAGDFRVAAVVAGSSVGTSRPVTVTPGPAAEIDFETFPLVVTAGVPAGNPPACAVRPGDEVSFDLIANDNVSLSEVEYTAFFSTTNSLRSRKVLVAQNTPLPVTTPFAFTVPGGALPESVPLVGLAVDGAGNRQTSDELILSVDLFVVQGGRQIAVIASGGPIGGPRDIAFDAAGNMFIANDGDNNLLSIAAGATAPFVFSAYNSASDFIVVDGSGRIYLSDGNDLWRVSATGAQVDQYVTFGGTARGLALDGAVVAKGIVDASGGLEGDSVTVGPETYELDVVGDGCTIGAVCVPIPAGANRNEALCGAIDLGSTVAGGAFDAPQNRCVVSAAAPGELGNSIVFTDDSLTITVTGAGTLQQGHDEEIFFGQTLDNNVYRLPETLTPVGNLGQNHGTFNVGRRQRGIAVRDATTASSVNLRDLYLYVIDDNATNSLRSYHAVDSVPPAQVFNVTGGAAGTFGSLWDVAIEPATCVLASDPGNGRIWLVDARDPNDGAPTVSLVASGFNDPRGLAFSGGELYVPDAGFDAVVRISPSPAIGDCF